MSVFHKRTFSRFQMSKNIIALIKFVTPQKNCNNVEDFTDAFMRDFHEHTNPFALPSMIYLSQYTLMVNLW